MRKFRGQGGAMYIQRFLVVGIVYICIDLGRIMS